MLILKRKEIDGDERYKEEMQITER